MKIIRKILQKKWISIYSSNRRRQLEKQEFTIISNNCWAGKVYNSYNIPYATPTIGCFIMPEDFIKLCAKLNQYMEMELIEIDPLSSKYNVFFNNNKKEYSQYGKYPVGVLEDIEIHFLHNNTFKEASDKWNRRKKRINWDNIIIKMNDQNGFKYEMYDLFSSLHFKNKIFFSATDSYGIRITKSNYVEYVDEPYGSSKLFNVTEYLNEVCQ